ncbi:MAG: hypothetical protein WC979_04865 [Candidatus Pacearchaeota archaeon]|jgi:hypothetical protein
MNLKKESILIRAFPIVITFAIMLLIFFSGPAEAYSLSLWSSDNSPDLGENINFIASLKIDNNEVLDVDYLILNLRGISPSVEINCKFSVNGTILSGCTGISIVQISSTLYDYGYNYGSGYGYGYKPGVLKYNISLNTTGYSPGKYETSLKFIAQNQTFEKSGDILTIQTYSGGGRTKQNSCYLNVGEPIMDKNIRGRGGIISADGTIFDTNNKLSMSIRSKGATRGSGSITSQKNRERFSYKFKITSVEDSKNQSLIYLKGTYRIGTKKSVPLNTILTINKATGQASLNESVISLEEMNLVFNGKGC